MRNEGFSPIDYRQLGKTVRILRTIRDYPQGQLAEKIGISREYMSAIEGGHKRPSTKTVEEIAKIFDIPTCFIYIMATQPQGEFNEEIHNASKSVFEKWMASNLQI